MPPKKNAVAKRSKTEVAEYDEMFSGHSGSGLENVGAKDVLIPRLAILQSLSPQLKKKKAEYIEGAEEGMICDVGTSLVFPDGVSFLPVYYTKEYLEWAPRESDKGLVNIHPTDEILNHCKQDDDGRWVTGDGNYISETAQFFGLNLSADLLPCFIPMSSTQLKKGRAWLTMAQSERLKEPYGNGQKAPFWFRSYFLTAAEESNNKGEWFSWNVARGPVLPELELDHTWQEIREAAINFGESLAAGSARGDISGMDGGSGGSGGTGNTDSDEGAM